MTGIERLKFEYILFNRKLAHLSYINYLRVSILFLYFKKIYSKTRISRDNFFINYVYCHLHKKKGNAYYFEFENEDKFLFKSKGDKWEIMRKILNQVMNKRFKKIRPLSRCSIYNACMRNCGLMTKAYKVYLDLLEREMRSEIQKIVFPDLPKMRDTVLADVKMMIKILEFIKRGRVGGVKVETIRRTFQQVHKIELKAENIYDYLNALKERGQVRLSLSRPFKVFLTNTRKPLFEPNELPVSIRSALKFPDGSMSSIK